MNEQLSKPWFSSAILGVSVIVGTIIVSYTLFQVKQSENTLVVTGSAKQHVTSDSVKWVGSFSRNVPVDGLRGGYAEMKLDESIISKFLIANGIEKTQVNFTPVMLEQPYQYDKSQPREYILRQTAEIQSNDIQKITSLAKNIESVVNQGVPFSTQSLEYYYSKLADLRINLLSDAVKDAQARASKIAESSGRKVGTIQSATMGVVQVLSPNSVDVSDYGAYDTSSIEKEVMVTVRTIFKIK